MEELLNIPINIGKSASCSPRVKYLSHAHTDLSPKFSKYLHYRLLPAELVAEDSRFRRWRHSRIPGNLKTLIFCLFTRVFLTDFLRTKSLHCRNPTRAETSSWFNFLSYIPQELELFILRFFLKIPFRYLMLEL